MKAEQRVRQLMSRDIPDGMEHASFGELGEFLHTVVARAVRQAENDVLERAAKYLGSPSLSTDNEDQAQGFRLGLESAAMSVRALKHEEP